MHAEYATFGLAPAMRAGGVLPGGAYQAHREFLDFIVDGRPLLLRLDDVDAVSPLAADLGPTVFTAHVQRLLLEAQPPLEGGRYVLYGCPECEGLDCGAVTAVIEREGDAIIWRDFAWQTDATADLERNGYPGIGPYRFHAAQYRSELEQVITDGAAEAPARRVLLVGARAAVLTRLANALRQIGISAEISRDAALASPDELKSYGAVAIGPSIGQDERAAVRAAFAAAGSDATVVDGLAPVVPVLVAQIEAALDRSAYDQRQLVALDVSDGAAALTVGAPCRVQLAAYRVDRLHRTRTHELLDTQLPAGTHHIALPARAAYVVARTTSSVLVARAL